MNDIDKALEELEAKRKELEEEKRKEFESDYKGCVEKIAKDLDATVETIHMPDSVKYCDTSRLDFGRSAAAGFYFILKLQKEKVWLGFGMLRARDKYPCTWWITNSEKNIPNLPLCQIARTPFSEEDEQKNLSIVYEAQQLIPGFILKHLDEIVQKSGIEKFDYTKGAKSHRYFPIQRKEVTVYRYTVKSNEDEI